MKESVLENEGKTLTFQQFLKSILYVGKGTGTRVFQHLKQARDDEHFSTFLPNPDTDVEPEEPEDSNGRAKRASEDEDEEEDDNAFDGDVNLIALPNDEDLTAEDRKAKIQAILKEWQHGYGIICYRVTVDVVSPEAFTVEAIAIEGYGNTKHGGSLTNLVRGHYGYHNKEFAKWFSEEDEDMPGVKQVEKISAVYYQKAFEAFKLQRHRPIYAHDVKHLKI